MLKFPPLLVLVLVSCAAAFAQDEARDARPNILFAIADDWGWPNASIYREPEVSTPAFDRISREGILFEYAFAASPSCTASRGAILTGRWPWQLRGAANLWSTFPDDIPTFPEILEEAGYSVGSTGKGWGPGRTETADREPAGERFDDFQQFLKARPKGKPFCFWLGSSDPHRPYEKGSGERSGMHLEHVRVPGVLPDAPVVRSDIADYYWEVQRFDLLVSSAIAALEEREELDQTIVVITSDHGMPFPRCKANLYDYGVRVPLAIRWPAVGRPGRLTQDLVSLVDVAPTFLQVAGIDPPDEMSGRSLLPILASNSSGIIDPDRTFVIFGKERHVPAQEAPSMGGYPSRGIRSPRWVYIRNFHPDRWPVGTPDFEKAQIPGAWYGDCDNGPTKTYMVENREKDELHRRLFDLAFGKRPAEELYDISNDPFQLENLAGDPERAKIQTDLATKLEAALRRTNDPRVLGDAKVFEDHPYFGGAAKHPSWKKGSGEGR